MQLQTTEIAQIQIGDDPDQERVLVTNLSEAENLLPLFLEHQKEGRQVNVRIMGRTIVLSRVY
jgi:hypothetical protein